MSSAPTFSTSTPNPDDATVAKREKHAAWDDEEEKEAGAVELRAPATASPTAEAEEEKGGPQQGAAAATAAAAGGGSMAVDDLITRGIKPATLRAITLVLACANAADAVEVLAVGFFLTVYRTNSGAELTSVEKEVLTGSIYMGMLIGGVCGGWLSDQMGRKQSLLGSLFLNGAAGLLSAAAPSLGWLALFRVLAGLGVGASVPCLFTLGAELFPVHSRGVHLSYIASFWMVGSIYAAVAAWILLGNNAEGARIMPHVTWRAFIVVAALPVFVTLALAWWLLPESPRYLIGNGQYHEAAKSLRSLTGADVTPEALMAQYAPDDDQEDDGANGGVGEIGPLTHVSSASGPSSPYNGLEDGPNGDNGLPTARTTATTTSSSSSCCSACGSKGALSGVALVFSGPLRLTTLRLTVVWFTLCFGTYGLNTWISTIFRSIGLRNEFLPTFLFALANGPGNLASFLLIERLGRKRLLAYSMLLAALASFLFAATSAHAPWLAVVAACAFQAFSVAGWNALDALSTESFPTAARTTGMGLLSGTGRLASLVAMVVNGSLEHSVALLFAVTGSFTVLGALTSFCLPYEPTGQSLDGAGGAVPRSSRGSSREGKSKSGRYVGFGLSGEREGMTEEMV